MRVLPVPGGPERKDRTDLACPGPVAWNEAGNTCRRLNGVQMLSRVSGSSASPGIDKTPDLIHESAMSQETRCGFDQSATGYYSADGVTYGKKSCTPDDDVATVIIICIINDIHRGHTNENCTDIKEGRTIVVLPLQDYLLKNLEITSIASGLSFSRILSFLMKSSISSADMVTICRLIFSASSTNASE